MTLHTTDHGLIEAVRRDHDPQQTQFFVEVHHPACLWYLRKRGMDPGDAEELAQQFCTDLLAGLLNKYDRQRGKFRPWLFAQLRYARADFYQARKRGEQGSGLTDVMVRLGAEPDQFAEFEQLCIAEALKWAMAKVFAEFGERDCRIFLRVESEGVDTGTVAAEFQLAPRTIRHVRDQVQKRLVELLEPLDCLG